MSEPGLAPQMARDMASVTEAGGVVDTQADERPTWPSVLRGWRCRCPACGAGPLLASYLKVRDACPVCGEELHHQRADDGPAYMTILIVGHILAPVMLLLYAHWKPDPLTTAAILSVACVGLSLYLLPRLKGAFVGLQWAKRMHGFGGDERG
ncbi:hypothetical protein XINFAN_02779 [Pseudogemmobacter humi]|uniref:DUF983 domain-containing protein n=2 Tax=Pseudogemmobacter humi TaxID=2483812 RepID=A0A3P5XK55_9RHOB|nr:hypothetical protein XINFAN_02779 [Pseudogemmobacter humi]